MKRYIITVLSVLSMLFIFAGCGSKTANDVGSNIQSTVDSAEDKVESGMNDMQNGNDNNSANTNTNQITKDEAKAIAFKHANVNEADVYDLDVDLEKDNGTSKYDISFETKSAEYDYDIHAETGEILSSSKDDKVQNNGG
ncbi:MAG: PepSY domain-containing protein [Clostridia bacterium]|nr:PepSY domain-containing protein [Clostridia bacterium]MEE1055060.1 PepSY domain-containing protein [Acutalibacteraceae bacterium]